MQYLAAPAHRVANHAVYACATVLVEVRTQTRAMSCVSARACRRWAQRCAAVAGRASCARAARALIQMCRTCHMSICMCVCRRSSRSNFVHHVSTLHAHWYKCAVPSTYMCTCMGVCIRTCHVNVYLYVCFRICIYIRVRYVHIWIYVFCRNSMAWWMCPRCTRTYTNAPHASHLSYACVCICVCKCIYKYIHLNMCVCACVRAYV